MPVIVSSLIKTRGFNAHKLFKTRFLKDTVPKLKFYNSLSSRHWHFIILQDKRVENRYMVPYKSGKNSGIMGSYKWNQQN
jgi:hypothetical protein